MKKIKVDSKNSGKRIDSFLFDQGLVTSRSRAQNLINSAHVALNKKIITRSSHIIKEFDEIELSLPEAKSISLKPENIPLDIIFQDKDIAVVNKPSNMVVHPSHGHNEHTMVNALLYHCDNLSMGFKEERPGIVHRIDKDTSGLLVVAKNDTSHQKLAHQFQNKTIHRLYHAVCFGPPPKIGKGRLESYLKRHEKDRKRYASHPTEGKLAISHYELLGSHNNEICLFKMKLETGRTHQIRVHLSDINCPIVADWTYTNTKRLKNISSIHTRKQIAELKRFLLHASELGFTHPKTDEKMFFSCLPNNEMKDFMINLNLWEKLGV